VRGAYRFHGLVDFSLRRVPPLVIARVEEKKKKRKVGEETYGLIYVGGLELSWPQPVMGRNACRYLLRLQMLR
jgi:hypothetical protein